MTHDILFTGTVPSLAHALADQWSRCQEGPAKGKESAPIPSILVRLAQKPVIPAVNEFSAPRPVAEAV